MNSIDSIKNMRYDTIRFQNYLLISPIDHPLKIDALISNTYLQPNTLFNDRSVEKTYEALNSIGSIKYVNIGFSELNDSLLNCHINVVLSKFIQVAYEAGATYSSTTATSTRAIGGAANISFVHRNAFKGSESLSLNLKASAEHMDIWAQEFGGQLGLKIPKFIFPVGKSDFKHSLHANTELSFGYKYQFRPKQFETTIMNGGVQYTWNDRFYKHSFQLINLNYIYYPHIDSYFRRLYLEPTVNTVTQKVEPSKFNPASFDNILIMSLGYFGTFSNAVASRPLQSYTTARYSFESAGSSIYGISKLFGLPQESNGVYRLLGVQYSQYLKGEYNITHHSIFDKNNRLVYHVGLGFMVPFANSDIVPYQKRFYSGGANSIRGWSEGTLGPGSYRRYQISGRDFNQVGDVKLELNIEYRTKIYRWFEGALFVDAGNVWTVKEYENQKDGAFHFNSFANQIAVAYGLGLRMDFSFFIFRMDMGVKLRDPVQEVQNRWRLEPTLMQDVALQIAIGYPF
jgi:outer membrane protein assembly factor BamA